MTYKHLINPAYFYVDWMAIFISRGDPAFNDTSYWRGRIF